MKFDVKAKVNMSTDLYESAKIKSESLGLSVSAYIRGLIIKDKKV